MIQLIINLPRKWTGLFMKIKNIIALTALSAMILSGCNSESKASELKESIKTEEYKPVPHSTENFASFETPSGIVAE